MARTPLLRAIERLARDHGEAERLGLTAAQLRDLSADAGWSRRQFLKRGGAAGAGALLLGQAAVGRPARAASGSPARVAVVGAGIAGLNAALTLQDKGSRRPCTRRPTASAVACTATAAATGQTDR